MAKELPKKIYGRHGGPMDDVLFEADPDPMFFVNDEEPAKVGIYILKGTATIRASAEVKED